MSRAQGQSSVGLQRVRPRGGDGGASALPKKAGTRAGTTAKTATGETAAMVEAGRFLTGMKEICKYVSRSEATVLNWIRDEEFPAKKLDGIWESHTAKIDDWRMKRWEAA